MAEPETEIVVENWGGSYNICKVNSETGKTVTYHGKVYSLLDNKSRKFAVVYKKEIQALSGPPGEIEILLDVGVGRSDLSFPDLRKKLEDLTHETALLEAKGLAKNLGLKVRER